MMSHECGSNAAQRQNSHDYDASVQARIEKSAQHAALSPRLGHSQMKRPTAAAAMLAQTTIASTIAYREHRAPHAHDVAAPRGGGLHAMR